MLEREQNQINRKSIPENRETAYGLTLNLWRVLVFIGVISMVFLFYGTRLYSLQVIEGERWLAQAEENRVKEINLPTLRGTITDRRGTVLARNIPSYDVILNPADLPDDAGATQEIYRQLSKLIGFPANLNEITPELPYVPCTSEHGIAQIAEYGIT